MKRLGVDTGGTFTDIVAVDGDEVRLLKTPSTPSNPAQAVAEGVRLSGVDMPYELLHGTTVATNAVLQQKGAKTAFVTTKGFGDLLRIGRQTRRRIYDLRAEGPPCLIPTDLVFEAEERIEQRALTAFDGIAGLEKAARKWADQGVESVAVCFINSPFDPRLERLAGQILGDRFYASLSIDVSPEYREYERASTTVLNAYVGPMMRPYLSSLSGSRVLIMRSDGGLMSAERAARLPALTLLSGPAAGVVGARAVGQSCGFEKLLTLDMGGTSTDVSLIDGDYGRSYSGEIDGLPFRLPRIDIETIGAGGGSIARLDPGGALRVGPESAGTEPGPACYGNGGPPTVTDACLVLGWILPDLFGYQGAKLDILAASDAIGGIARGLGLSVSESAQAIVELAREKMARALRWVSAAKGYDPAEFSLLPFGGGGGLHACALCERLGMKRFLVPTAPGLLSAWGLLLADVAHEETANILHQDRRPERPGDIDPKAVEERFLDLRYVGQSYEITVPENGAERSFHERHRQLYGFADESKPIQAVNRRVRWTVKPATAATTIPVAPVRYASGEIHAWLDGVRMRLPVVPRSDFRQELLGPALVVQHDSTTLIEPGWRATILNGGEMLVEMV
ncbi:MAG: hydantoinase/oxoprolinase family protein [Armatimonadetes bacterium]|nr:hydantoinase/oxoprolinase family protein [Armatimonadota bacterium]